MKRIERKNAKLCLQLLQYLAGIFTTKKAHLPFEDAALHHKGPLICTNKIKHLCHVAHLHKYPTLEFQDWDALHGFLSKISYLEPKPVQAPSISEEERSCFTIEMLALVAFKVDRALDTQPPLWDIGL